MNKVIVFIRSNGIQKLNVAEMIRDMGYQIAIAEKGYSNSGNMADYVIDTDTNNLDELLTDIAEFALTHPVNAILSFTEFGIEQAAAVAQILGYKGPNLASVKKCRNKYLTRISMKKSGLPTPGFFKACSLGEIKEKLPSISLPAIIKPLNFAGACAVVKIDTPEMLDEGFAQLQEQRQTAPVKDYMTDTTEAYWLVEEYLEGFEISVEGFAFDGQVVVTAIHDKMCRVEAPYFLEEVFVTPSPRITPALAETIKIMTRDAIAAVGFVFGLFHVEYRVSAEGPVLIEINCRQGGGLVPESVYHSTGVNLPQLLVKMSLGIPPDVELAKQKPVVFQMLIASEGNVQAVHGFDEARQTKTLKIVEQWLKTGDVVKARQANYGGFLLAAGENGESVEEMIETVRCAAEKITFIVN